MAMHAVYDVLSCSLSRCFGAEVDGASVSPVSVPRTAASYDDALAFDRAGGPPEDGGRTGSGGGSGGGGTGKNNRRRDRRAMGLSLKDKEWDVLFDDGDGGKADRAAGNSAGTFGGAVIDAAKTAMGVANREIEYADVAARARSAADPDRHRTPTKGPAGTRRGGASEKSDDRDGCRARKNRSRSRTRKDDIFRLRCGAGGKGGAGRSGKGGFMSSIGAGINQTLCFAAPLRNDEDRPNSPGSPDGRATIDDEQTLNTCEETITSTLYYDSKLKKVAPSVVGRPPMPLFEQFRVESRDGRARGDEIGRIVRDRSHKTESMLGVILAYHKDQRKIEAAPLEATGDGAGAKTPGAGPVVVDGASQHGSTASSSGTPKTAKDGTASRPITPETAPPSAESTPEKPIPHQKEELVVGDVQTPVLVKDRLNAVLRASNEGLGHSSSEPPGLKQLTPSSQSGGGVVPAEGQ